MTGAYPNVAAVAPELVLRLTAAVDAIDADALGALDADVRRLVAALVANPAAANANVVLVELAGLYQVLRTNCETHRANLQRLMAQQRRAEAGVSAYRSSGATSLNP